MVKIDYKINSGIFIIILGGFLVHPLFFSAAIPWEAAFLAACCLPLGVYASFSLRAEPKKAAALAFLVGGLVLMCAGQYVFSFFIQNLKPHAAALMLSGIDRKSVV